MSDWSEPIGGKPSNLGFRYGLIGAAVSISVNLLFLLINQGEQTGDFLSWLVQLSVYFFFSRAAAEAQYQANQRAGRFEYLRGVQGAGVGASLLTSILTWAYIIIRGIVRDSFGVFVFVEPVSLFCLVAFDVAVAISFGSWNARAVIKHHPPD